MSGRGGLQINKPYNDLAVYWRPNLWFQFYLQGQIENE